MAEAAATSAAQASTVTPGATGIDAKAAPKAAETTSPAGQGQTKQPVQAAKPGDPAKEGAPPAEEFEEIKIGSVAGKVPKEIAKALKDLERGFHSKSQESASMKREFQALAAAFKENPDIGFKVFGVDPDQYSQAKMAKWLEDQMMTPDQKRLRELEERDKTWQQKEAEAKKKQEQEQMTAAEAKEEAEIQESLMNAWKSSGMDPDPWVGQKIVATYMAAQDQKLGWTWEQCAAKVKQDLGIADQRRLSKMSVEDIRGLLGDEILKKLREDDVKRVTDKASETAAKKTEKKNASPAHQAASQPKKNFEGRRVVSQEEWDNAWDSL